MARLAIEGAPPLINRKLPYRRQFGEEELHMVAQVFEDSWRQETDFGFQGRYEAAYCRAFAEYQGGGFADAVSSGTAAMFVALAALDIPAGSEVIFSPVTDPGGIAPALFLNLQPVIVDSSPGSFNIDPDLFRRAVTPATKAAVITHLGGIPVEIGPIVSFAKEKNIRIIEDCSQAHGAVYKGERVGRIGDVGVFSTMFSKNHSTGGCGGVVFTRDEELYNRMRSMADRGKPFHHDAFDPKDPAQFLFPALNFNQDELSCAIGISTLGKLQETIEKRLVIYRKIKTGLQDSKVLRIPDVPEHLIPSFFYITIQVNSALLKVTKKYFAEAVAAEGVWVNPDYHYVVSEWPWLSNCISRKMLTPNASQFREESFNILFNERFTDDDVKDVIACLRKVEEAMRN